MSTEISLCTLVAGSFCSSFRPNYLAGFEEVVAEAWNNITSSGDHLLDINQRLRATAKALTS
jgi:hypothetical protein